jgi:hypothetical protein
MTTADKHLLVTPLFLGHGPFEAITLGAGIDDVRPIGNPIEQRLT